MSILVIINVKGEGTDNYAISLFKIVGIFMLILVIVNVKDEDINNYLLL